VLGSEVDQISIERIETGEIRLAQRCCCVRDRTKDRLYVVWRVADDAQDFASGSLLFEAFIQATRKFCIRAL
jgi:hypothetical protein